MLMRILTIYLLLVAAFYSLLSFSRPQNPTADKSAHSKQEDIGQENKTDEASDRDSLNCEIKTPRSDEAQNDSANQTEKGWLYRTYLISGPVIGIIALGTGIMVWRQIVALKRIERAWIVLRGRPQLPSIELMKRMVGGERPQPYLYFMCTFINMGKTPAMIVSCEMKFSLIDKLPKRPNYETANATNPQEIPLHGKFIPPGGEWGPVHDVFRGPVEFVPTAEEFSEMRHGGVVCYAHCRVRYRDTFKSMHETRVCYVWHVPKTGNPSELGFVLGGPPEYNKNT